MESEAFYFINQGHSPNFLFFYIKKKKGRVKIALKIVLYNTIDRVFRGQGNRQNQLLKMPDAKTSQSINRNIHFVVTIDR